MVISKLELKYCQLEFFGHYAILTMYKDSKLTKSISAEISEHLQDYYQQRDFIFITHRIYSHEIDLDVYKGKVLKNMKGFAVVSKNPEEFQRAMIEQPLWNKSFVFFEDLKDAIDWAESFF